MRWIKLAWVGVGLVLTLSVAPLSASAHEAHRWAGTSALFLGAGVLWICERVERRGGSRHWLRVMLSLQAILISSVGFLGGSLLYGIGHLWQDY